MDTAVDEIAEGVFRFSTWIPDITEHGFTFNQFLLTGDQPFLFHTGQKFLYPNVSQAVSRHHRDPVLRRPVHPHRAGPGAHRIRLRGAGLAAEGVFHATGLTTTLTLDQLADLGPTTLAIMHGSSYAGDGAAQLRSLRDGYAELAERG